MVRVAEDESGEGGRGALSGPDNGGNDGAVGLSGVSRDDVRDAGRVDGASAEVCEGVTCLFGRVKVLREWE